MPFLLRSETTKLFYNEYAYKLVVRNQLAHLFREKNYSWAKQNLDKLQHQFENGRHDLIFVRGLRNEAVDPWDLQQAQLMFHEFTRFDDMKLRVEQPRIQVYSNNLTWLEKLSNKLDQVVEWWEPQPHNLDLLKANTIISNKHKGFDYKVTLSKRTPNSFANWVDNNRDKIKMGPVTYQEIKNQGYTKGLYFYVRDEKVLNLVNIMIAGSIQRIDKIVYSVKTDK